MSEKWYCERFLEIIERLDFDEITILFSMLSEELQQSMIYIDISTLVGYLAKIMKRCIDLVKVKENEDSS